MLRQIQAQTDNLSVRDIRTLKKTYALEVVYYNWPGLKSVADRRGKAFLGLCFVVMPHFREQIMAPISIQLNQLYREALELEANTWELTVYIEDGKVFVRPMTEKPKFMEEFETK